MQKTHPLITAYCSLVEERDKIQRLLDQMKPFVDELDLSPNAPTSPSPTTTVTVTAVPVRPPLAPAPANQGAKKHPSHVFPHGQGHERSIITHLYTGPASLSELGAALPQYESRSIQQAVYRCAKLGRITEVNGKWRLTDKGMDRCRMYFQHPGCKVLRQPKKLN